MTNEWILTIGIEEHILSEADGLRIQEAWKRGDKQTMLPDGSIFKLDNINLVSKAKKEFDEMIASGARYHQTCGEYYYEAGIGFHPCRCIVGGGDRIEKKPGYIYNMEDYYAITPEISRQGFENRQKYNVPDEVDLVPELLTKLQLAETEQKLLASGQKLLGAGEQITTVEEIIAGEVEQLEQEKRKKILLGLFSKNNHSIDCYGYSDKKVLAEWKKVKEDWNKIISEKQKQDLRDYLDSLKEYRNRKKKEWAESARELEEIKKQQVLDSDEVPF